MSFLEERHKESGGYAATRLLPATVEDTFQALDTLRLLNTFNGSSQKVLISKADRFFLRQKWQRGDLGFKGAYQVLLLLSWAQDPPPLKEIKGFIRRNLYRFSSLEEFFYGGQICQKFGLPRPFGPGDLPPLSSTPVIKDLFFWLALNKSFFPRRTNKRWGRWLRESQNCDGGFGFKPGTTSFIDTTRYALEAFRLLVLSPRDAKALGQFLWACRRPQGGFSRRPGAAPFLDATWHAVVSIVILSYVATLASKRAD